ncbi:MAG: 5-bromo-4-chloroindolyl phosphate hydrolysis family protein, partial [Thermoleophilia bacterium]|nr:5-bromo-4-chloroindolyl phosphate hydrolysis family protein [Thermoleophilia bacterium]
MPLGGYCTVCQRWVWLTPYGECQNGHPALAVKDVQQLKPQAESDVLVGEIVEDGPRRARFRWWWRHSLWIGWTFTLGFMNWLAFIYVGVRARHTPWTLLGFAYMVPLVLTILAIGTPLLQAAIVIQLLVSAASVVNALYLRPYYRAIMFGDASPRSLPAPPQPPALAAGARPQLPKNIDERAAEVLQPARRQVDAILRTAGSIGKPAVRDEVVGLCATADQIIAELAAQPRKLDAARGFLTYYLDAAQRIVEGYVNLGQRGSSTAEINQTLDRAEASLKVVQQAFDRQLANVLEDRALDLESEIELLERT